MNKPKVAIQHQEPVAVRLDAARLPVGAIVLVLGWPSRHRLVEVREGRWWFVPLDQPDMRPFAASSGAAKLLPLPTPGATQQPIALATATAKKAVHKSDTPNDSRANSAPGPARRPRGRPRKAGPVSRWTVRRRTANALQSQR